MALLLRSKLIVPFEGFYSRKVLTNVPVTEN
jgi:hypothetical protein